MDGDTFSLFEENIYDGFPLMKPHQFDIIYMPLWVETCEVKTWHDTV